MTQPKAFFSGYLYFTAIIVTVFLLVLSFTDQSISAQAQNRQITKPNRAYKLSVKGINQENRLKPEKMKSDLKALALGYPKDFREFIDLRRKKIKESGSPVKRRDNRLIEPEKFSQLSHSAKKYFNYKYNIKSTLAKPQEENFSDKLFLADPNNENILVNSPSQDKGKLRTQSETSATSFGKTIVVSFNDSSGVEQKNFSGVAVSQDSGMTWKQSFIPNVGGFNLGDGVVATDTKGNFYYAMIAFDSNNRSLVAVSRSLDGGKTWKAPVDASTSAGGDDDFQDKEWLAVDRSAKSRFKDNVYITWTRFPDFGTTKIMFAASRNRGKKFQTPVVIAQAIDRDSVIQGSMVATGPNGEIYIVWSDRSLVGLFGKALIRFSKSTDGGKTFSAPTTIASFTNPAYPANGVFSGNPFPSIAVDISNTENQGSIYITYAGRSENIPDRADVLLVSSKDGGSTWTNQIKLNDDNSIAEQILPSVAVTDDGAVGVTWYDRRNDLANLSLLDIYATVSKDGGKNFSPNQRITTANWPLIPTPLDLRAGYHGDYSQLATMGNKFLFNWGDDRNGSDTDVYVALKSADEIINISKSDFIIGARNSSQVTKAGGTASFFVNTKVFEGDKNFTFEATSSFSGFNFEFTPFLNPEMQNPLPEGFKVTVRTPANIVPGPYFIMISARRGDITRSTAVRLTILSDNQLAREQQNITNNSSGSILPVSSIDKNGNINFAWLDDSPGVFSIFFARSTDGGKTFSTPVMIPRNESFIGQPILLSNEKNIFVVHLEVFDSPTFIIRTVIFRSDDNGKSFSLVNTLQDDNLFIVSESAQMDIDGTIHLAASTLNPADPQKPTFVNFDMRSVDGGKTFTLNKIFEGTSSLSSPILIVEGDGKNTRSVFVDFNRQREGLYITNSTDGGLTYAQPTLVTNKIDDLVSATFFPATNTTHFLINRGSFQEENFQLFYTKSGMDGKFMTEQLISNSSIQTILSQSLSADDLGNLVVAFEGSDKKLSDTNFGSRIFYLTSKDAGASFSALKSFEPVGGNDFSPIVLQDLRGELSIIWQGVNKGVLDTFYSVSPDRGQNFPTPINLNSNAGISIFADLSFDKDGRIQLLSQDNTGGSFDIFRTKLGAD
ncbi:MAG: exo-alpha-sialidase [Acidobacteria bacterium]|nr:exo-alpha-sialidase [Acidobacteriota bacterium]